MAVDVPQPIGIPVESVVEEVEIDMEQDWTFSQIGQQRCFVVSYLVCAYGLVGNGQRVDDRVKAN